MAAAEVIIWQEHEDNNDTSEEDGSVFSLCMDIIALVNHQKEQVPHGHVSDLEEDMLCDLCESVSHTYCVGLGDTVPEGDWFCRDCTLLRDARVEDDKDLDADGFWGNQTSFWNHHILPHILDIVREPSSHRSSSNRSRLSSTQVHDCGISTEAAIVEHNSQAEYPVGRGRSQFEARTLQRCRNVDGRIRALRENWYRIREGSLSFSSIVISNGSGDVLNGNSSQLNSSSYSQSRPQKSSSSNIIPKNDTQDIDKAWKMMNVAKSIEKKRCISNVLCSSNGLKRSLWNIKTPKESGSGRTMVRDGIKLGNKDRDGIRLGNLNPGLYCGGKT